ncbi:Atxe2 family lasso peptide isopeptidase [Sphingomonas immobilis]|uniref:Atxe2 family lasso peptide isopeptidase n=1 Tax=Sphingomonas immobilis TaxID=3063997 RepID=A0ABT9A187_9SPHN|nr:Atxe2 family lasso peptide isopeptidase [Sphingomonas sp. CA1-15]MDO7843594.1 Atxe2 family lasso peptide isopeptidase [Sphingomonas sp. CA1-15]
MVRAAILFAALVTANAVPAWADCSRLLPSADEAAIARRHIAPRDLVEMRDVGLPDGSTNIGASPLALSPDGKWIAFVLNRADLESDGYCRALIVVSADGEGAPRVLDRGGDLILGKGVYRGLLIASGFPQLITPRWSPDGRSIGYLRRDGDVTQVWRVGADGGGAVAVTKSPTDVESWRWSGDGGAILYETRPAVVAIRAKMRTEADSGYLYDDRIRPNAGPFPHLREAEVPLETFRHDLASGTTVAVSARDRAPDDDRSGYGFDGRKAGLEPVSLNPNSGLRLWVDDATGKRQSCLQAACSDGLVTYWWADEDMLIFQRREGWARGKMAFYRWRPGHGDPERILAGDDWLTGCLYRAEHLFCLAQTATTPAHVVSVALATRRSTTLFDPNPVFARLDLGTVERLTWSNDIGLPARGDLVLPPGYVHGTKLPLVIVQYQTNGFLRGGTGDDHPIFPLAAAGFAVLSINNPAFFGTNDPHITTIDQAIGAMGANWSERRSLLSSLLTGLDQSVARGIADPKRIGITGLSDGASSAAFALVNTRRFAAASLSTCCEEPKTVMTYGGIGWADWNHQVRRYPRASADDVSFWKPMSLSLSAAAIDTPILMQLADREYLLGLEAFTALRENGKTVELSVQPDEYHIRVHPRHRLADYIRDIDWFGFWLKGATDADPAKAEQYRRWTALRSLSSAPGHAP